MKLLALTPPANIYFAKERVLDEELISGRAEFLFFNSFVEAACGAFYLLTCRPRPLPAGLPWLPCAEATVCRGPAVPAGFSGHMALALGTRPQ